MHAYHFSFDRRGSLDLLFHPDSTWTTKAKVASHNAQYVPRILLCLSYKLMLHIYVPERDNLKI